MALSFFSSQYAGAILRHCCLGIFIFCSSWLFAGRADAYGASLVLEYKDAAGFSYVEYGYSSLFRQGRDDFHWLDFTFGEYDYVLQSEAGRAQEVASIYRYARRLRWARHFKPIALVEVGIARRDRSSRRRINHSINELSDNLPSITESDYRLALGAGYLWEKDSMLWMLGIKNGYIGAFRETYWGAAFQFSFQF